MKATPGDCSAPERPYFCPATVDTISAAGTCVQSCSVCGEYSENSSICLVPATANDKCNTHCTKCDSNSCEKEGKGAPGRCIIDGTTKSCRDVAASDCTFKKLKFCPPQAGPIPAAGTCIPSCNSSGCGTFTVEAEGVCSSSEEADGVTCATKCSACNKSSCETLGKGVKGRCVLQTNGQCRPVLPSDCDFMYCPLTGTCVQSCSKECGTLSDDGNGKTCEEKPSPNSCAASCDKCSTAMCEADGRKAAGRCVIDQNECRSTRASDCKGSKAKFCPNDAKGAKLNSGRCVKDCEKDCGDYKDGSFSATCQALPSNSGVLSKSLERDVSALSKGMEKIGKMIERQEQLLRQNNLSKERSKASVHQQHYNSPKVKERRKLRAEYYAKINECIDELRGGSDIVYTVIKDFLHEEVSQDEACFVLKGLTFPEFAKFGFVDPSYDGPHPNHNGSAQLYYGRAKDELFKCMCTWTSEAVLPSNPLEGKTFTSPIVGQEELVDKYWKPGGYLEKEIEKRESYDTYKKELERKLFNKEEDEMVEDEETNGGEAEETNGGEAEKTNGEEAEKTNGEEAEEINGGEAEKTNVGEAEKTNDSNDSVK
eukprot:g3689.t1